jgi:hypothetical protein
VTGLIGGLTWEDLAKERRPRRLTRGKHFTGDVRALQKEATAAGRRLGCAVRTVRDDFLRFAYLWVQFADHEVPLGEPCPACGSRELIRMHEQFGYCPRCRCSLAFSQRVRRVEPRKSSTTPVVAERSVEGQHEGKLRVRQRRMDAFTDARLAMDPTESDDEKEMWYGRARYEGEEVLLRVVYPLRDRSRIPDPDNPGGDLHYVTYSHLDPYDRARRLGVLED